MQISRVGLVSLSCAHPGDSVLTRWRFLGCDLHCDKQQKSKKVKYSTLKGLKVAGANMMRIREIKSKSGAQYFELQKIVQGLRDKVWMLLGSDFFWLAEFNT